MTIDTVRTLDVSHRIWQVPVYLPYLQPPLTESAIQAAERHWRVTLPKAFLAALRIFNGGAIRQCSVPRWVGGSPSNLALLDTIWGIGPRQPSILEHSWDAYKSSLSGEPKEFFDEVDLLLPFCGDGQYLYCLDYREVGRDGEPCVTHVSFDGGVDESFVATDFRALLVALCDEQRTDALALVTGMPMDSVVEKIANATGVLLTGEGDQDFGFPFFAGELSDGTTVRLKPNYVRLGFVPKDHVDYERLRDFLPNIVPRYPEHFDCGYFLTLDRDNDVVRAFGDDLKRMPFTVRSVIVDDE